MTPQTAIEFGKLTYSSFFVSQCSINYFKGEHALTQFWSNFEITKCCGYREYKVKVIKT